MKYWRQPLDRDEVKVPRGKVIVLEERCKGCGFCVEYCPKDVLELSKRFNRKGYHPPDVVTAEDCVNCHLCEMICPDFAIFSLELTDVEEAGSEEECAAEPSEGVAHESRS